MKKIINFSLSFLILIALFLPLTASANTIPQERLDLRLVDNAGLLTAEERSNLVKKLDEISERQELDIVILAVSTLDGYTPTEYADDFFDYVGYGYGKDSDGILFLLSMEDRDWAISTHGYGITAFTDAGQKHLMSMVLPELKDNNFYSAFNIFADQCDDFISKAKTDEPYDRSNLPKKPLSLIWIPIALLVGVFIAFIITSIMKNKLKTVSMQAAAASYLIKDSLNLTGSRELFLYTILNKTPRPKETSSSSSGSSTHTSSSGRSHGGSSGKF